MKADVGAVLLGVLVFAGGVGLVFTSGSPRISNVQAQGLVLALAAGVAAWYAAETRRMADASEASVLEQLRARGDAQKAEVYVWPVDVVNRSGSESMKLVVENAGPGISENVMLFPLLRQRWEKAAPRRLMADTAAEVGEDLRQEDLKNRMWYRPVLRPGAQAFCISFGLDREDSVVCLAWDDSWRGRQFSCFRIAYEEQDIDATLYLAPIRGPHSRDGKSCVDLCPVFRKLGDVCPHEWQCRDRRRYDAAMREDYYRAQW